MEYVGVVVVGEQEAEGQDDVLGGGIGVDARLAEVGDDLGAEILVDLQAVIAGNKYVCLRHTVVYGDLHN